MKVFYDWEFHNPSRTPISVGMVAEDGATLYRVYESPAVLHYVNADPWHRANLGPVLPFKPDLREGFEGWWQIDPDHPEADCVKTPAEIRLDVDRFLAGSGGPSRKVQLWGDYAAYDHVYLAAVFGEMSDWPHYLPMWTHDLQQALESAGLDKTPPHLQGLGRPHHALDDALETKAQYDWLQTHRAGNLRGRVAP